MTICGGKEEFQETRKAPFCPTPGRGSTSRASGASGESMRRKLEEQGRASDRTAGTPEGSSPVRRSKIEEAKRKKQNGEYDSQEVYRKIAERLVEILVP
jgi:hypothetical protein